MGGPGGEVHEVTGQLRLGELQPAHRFVDFAHAHQIEQEVRSGVVADAKHQKAKIVERQLRGGVEIVEDTATADSLLVSGIEAFIQAEMAEVGATQQLNREIKVGGA